MKLFSWLSEKERIAHNDKPKEPPPTQDAPKADENKGDDPNNGEAVAPVPDSAINPEGAPPTGAVQRMDLVTSMSQAELSRLADEVGRIASEHKTMADVHKQLVAFVRGLAEKVGVLAANHAALENASKELSQRNDRFYETSVLEPVIRSIFPLYDTVVSLEHHTLMSGNETSAEQLKLLGALKTLVEEYLQAHGVEPFVHAPGTPFDKSRMRALREVPTDDETLHLRVAKSCQHGFHRGERVLRPEAVMVYRANAKKQGEAAADTNGQQT